MAELRFVGFLAERMGRETCEVSLEKPTRLRDILPNLPPNGEIIILIDQKPGHLDSMIRNDNRVVLMPTISGG